MLAFSYSKGSSALAAHILLLEVAADFAPHEVSISKGEHQTPGFLKRNRKGRIPVLETPDGILTENPAILEYIAATHPSAGLVPEDAYQQAQARSLCAYLCATAHVAFAHLQRGTRWACEDASLTDMRAQAPRNLAECAMLLEDDLPLLPWALGADYSFCDPYLFQFTRWLDKANVDLTPYPKLAAHRHRMRARPAVQKAMAEHDLE